MGKHGGGRRSGGRGGIGPHGRFKKGGGRGGGRGGGGGGGMEGFGLPRGPSFLGPAVDTQYNSLRERNGSGGAAGWPSGNRSKNVNSSKNKYRIAASGARAALHAQNGDSPEELRNNGHTRGQSWDSYNGHVKAACARSSNNANNNSHRNHDQQQRQNNDNGTPTPNVVGGTFNGAAGQSARDGANGSAAANSSTSNSSRARNLLASALSQQTPRRRIEFHAATRPDTAFSTSGSDRSSSKSTAADVAARGAHKGSNDGSARLGEMAERGGGGGGGKEGVEGKRARLGDEQIGLPHAEKVL